MSKLRQRVKVGPFVVQRTLSSSVDYRVIHEHHWCGYLCPWNTPKNQIGIVGKFVDVTTFQELQREREAYRAEIDPFAQVQFAYYEVIEASPEVNPPPQPSAS